MNSSKSCLQQQIRPPSKNLITVLSIDGGGIRGIIPGVILSYLESQLQVKQFNLNIHIHAHAWNECIGDEKMFQLRQKNCLKLVHQRTSPF